MALTTSEERRIQELEAQVAALTVLISGAGSKNQLNRIEVLATEDYEKMNEKLTALEAEVEELLDGVRKLQ